MDLCKSARGGSFSAFGLFVRRGRANLRANLLLEDVWVTGVVLQELHQASHCLRGEAAVGENGRLVHEVIRKDIAAKNLQRSVVRSHRLSCLSRKVSHVAEAPVRLPEVLIELLSPRLQLVDALFFCATWVSCCSFASARDAVEHVGLRDVFLCLLGSVGLQGIPGFSMRSP